MKADIPLLSHILGLLAAFLGNAVQALGFVLQKMGVTWLGRKGLKDKAFRRDRFLWMLGFTAINIVPIFQFLALASISTAALSSMTGICVVLTVFFSRILLGARIQRSDWIWSFLILIGIGVASYFGAEGLSRGYSSLALVILSILPEAAGLPVFFVPSLRGNNRLRARWFAAIAGAASGIMIVQLKALRIDCGSEFFAYLSSPWLYLYMINGAFSLTIHQFAYKAGEMIVIAPIQFGVLVIYPVFASFFVFGSIPIPIQLLAFMAIIVSIVMIVRRHDK
jgi:drug/metabolite transporter (DMT)-like permease